MSPSRMQSGQARSISRCTDLPYPFLLSTSFRSLLPLLFLSTLSRPCVLLELPSPNPTRYPPSHAFPTVHEQIQQHLSDGTSIVTEAINNVRTVRSVSAEDYEFERHMETRRLALRKVSEAEWSWIPSAC